MKSIVLTLALSILSITFSFAQVTGTWKTIDDETGKAKSLVKIYKGKDGKVYGKIIKLFKKPGEDPNPSCTECTDYRKDKKIIGMVIITGLTRDDEVWEGDDAILDPENGKIYDCKIWVDENNNNLLNVRGYIAFFFRTQTWERVK